MKFLDVIYYLLKFKTKDHFLFYVDKFIDFINIPKEEIIRFKFKNRDIIKNNKKSNVSSVKLFENNILEAYVTFYFDKNLVNINKQYSKIIYNNKDPKDTYFSKEFITSINIYSK